MPIINTESEDGKKRAASSPTTGQAIIEAPTVTETLGAAFRTENLVGSTLAYGDTRIDGLRTNPDYDPITRVKELGRPELMSQVLTADNDNELQGIIEREDKLAADRDIIDRSGAVGLVSSLTAGVLDITSLLPLGVALKAGKGVNAISAGVRAGAIGGALEGAGTEAALALTQGDTDSALVRAGVGLVAGAVLGAGIGAGIGTLAAKRGARPFPKSTVDQELVDTNIDALKTDIEHTLSGVERAPIDLSTATVEGPDIPIEESTRLVNEAGIKTINKISTIGQQWLQSPSVKGLTSSFGTMRKLTDSLFEHAFKLKSGSRSTLRTSAMESRVSIDHAEVTKLNSFVRESIASEAKEGGWISQLPKGKRYAQFSIEVAKVLRGGESLSPAISKVAAKIRTAFDSKIEQLQEVGILEEGFVPDSNWLARRYRRDVIISRREDFVQKLSNHFVRKNPSLSLADATASANKTTDRILNQSPDEAAFFGLSEASTSGGKLGKERILDIDESEFGDFIDNDGLGVASGYLFNSSSIINFKRALQQNGVESVSELRTKIVAEHNVAVEAIRRGPLEEAEKVKKLLLLDKELQNVTKSGGLLDNMRDISLGVLDKSSRTRGGRFLKTLRRFNTIVRLGNIVLTSAFSDIASTARLNNFLPTMQNLASNLTDSSAVKAARGIDKEWMKDLSVGLELENDAILARFYDPDNDAAYSVDRDWFSRVEDVSEQVAHAANRLNGFAYYQYFARRTAGELSASFVARASARHNNGTLRPQDIERLERMGLVQEILPEVYKQYRVHGARSSLGGYISGIGTWDKGLRDQVGPSILAEVNNSILLPSKGDIPEFAQGHALGRLLTQFKSFAFGAQNRLLYETVQGSPASAALLMARLTAAGYMSYVTKSLILGKDIEVDPFTILAEGMSRSGALGITGDILSNVSPLVSGSRYAGQSSLSWLAGPTVSGAADLIPAAGRVVTGNGNDSDSNKLLRLLPLFNNSIIQRTFNEVFGD